MNEKAIRKQLGMRIKTLREQKGWRQEDIQDKTEFSSRYLGRIERGTVNPTLDTLLRLCEIFEVELSELFRLIDTEKETSLQREKLVVKLTTIIRSGDPDRLRKLGVFIDEIL
ncbi:MAG: helix-turn-helix transcriptional regulator [Desulfobacterales bacterium]|nr:helix-turn-helix transcriptional regulator [Desulfobacterales bacterium]